MANIAWLALIPAEALYFRRQLSLGVYPIEADSIGLPILGIAMWVFVLLVPLNLVWWFLLRDYPGALPLRTMGTGLSARARVIGIVSLVVAIGCAIATLIALAENAWEVAPVFLAWSYITLSIRAAYLGAKRLSLNRSV